MGRPRRDYVDEVVELAPCPSSAIKAAAHMTINRRNCETSAAFAASISAEIQRSDAEIPGKQRRK
ncbi:hypothetical protein [Mycobacterium tuberculosis]|uniref:hypothetical protein n=1 Tax=Mycobacterium tuberculosis TaxID=1773 RepID=UPI0021C5C7CD|nr:hypothetical protein [Mycobacterium tuberculosis]MCU0195684.1 hypothetical protein [Mycobacterium tuberculosis]